MGGPRVLLADDEDAITGQLAPFLERSGFEVIVVDNGQAALEAARNADVALCVLDVVMPALDGRGVLRHMRSEGLWQPVLLLTQVGGPSERAMALEEGADDYLNKPFEPVELVARIRAVLRRADPGRPSLGAAGVLQSGRLRLDRISRRAWLADRELNLTPRAMALLDYLMSHPDELLGRQRILEAVWGFDFPVGTRAVDHRIAEVRRAIDDDPAAPTWITTVPSEGYRFTGQVRGQR